MQKKEVNICLVGLNCIKQQEERKIKLLFYSNTNIKELTIEYNEKKENFKTKKLGDEIYFIELKLFEEVKQLTITYKEIYKESVKIKFKKVSVLKPRFNQMDLIGIQFFSLVGIKNPAFIVQGTVASKDFKFKILADEEMLEITEKPLDDEYSFSLVSKVKKTSKNIYFILSINKEDFEVIALKNNIWYRIDNKCKSSIKLVVAKVKNFLKVIKRGIRFLWREHHFLVPPYLWPKYFKALIYRMKNIHELFYDPFSKEDYNNWLKENKEEIEIKKFSYNPLISFLIPVYNVKGNYLEECLNSILNQTYENFEVCLVDDCSTKEETKEVLKEYEKKDKRIKVKYRKENGHISKATNDALKMAKGEFVALVDNDDLLDKNALYYNVKALNENRNIDMLYSDEDKLDIYGRYCEPHFKPDFSPDTLLSLNYICHFTVLRKSLVENVGGFEVGVEGAQDHDLFLKVSEKTKNIYHIPKILYHWRMSETSTAMNLKNKNYINDIGLTVVKNALKRRKIKATVTRDPMSTYFIVEYETPKNPLISIIIPTKDYADTLDICLKSLFKKTTYKNYEVIVVNNNSEKEETFALFEKYKKKYPNFKVIDANFEFNYSKINNIAVKQAKGEYILLLNNDTEIIDSNWLKIMLGYAMQPHIGAVGPKLLYPDTTVQHAGVILGLGGVASHAYLGRKRNDPGMYGRLRVPYDYACVTAACLMVSKKKYNEVGGLEEELQVAYNDVDFNIKLLEKGYNNICVPQTELFHFESKSRGLDNTSEKYKRFLKESKYMYDKWEYQLLHDKYYNPNFTLKYWFVLEREENKKEK